MIKIKFIKKVRDYISARDIPYDLIRGIITATCGVLLGLISSTHFNGINKKRQYRQLVLNAVYDMNRTCLQSRSICKLLQETDSLYALTDSLYAINPSLVADSTAEEMMSIFVMPLHPLKYNTIEGVLREDMRSFENIDDIELESMMNDFYAVRDQFLDIFSEHNRRAETVFDAVMANARGIGCDDRLYAIKKSPQAMMFFKIQHPEYTSSLQLRCASMEKQFAAILDASDFTIDDLDKLSREKSGRPLKINNPYISKKSNKDK